MELNEKQKVELAFWKGEIERLGKEGFLKVRKADWTEKTKHFQPALDKEIGDGLDLGCGLMTIFEYAPRLNQHITATDPLLPEYYSLLDLKDSLKMMYAKISEDSDDDKLKSLSESFDFVFCCNVIDHTPNPKQLII